MRIFLFFNEFSSREGTGRGHVRIELREGQKLTEELVLYVERQCKAAGGYDMFVITGWQELEA
jgi:hypothetical protein